MNEMVPINVQNLSVGINDLPNELIEYILSFLPPYKDLENCMVVCKRWQNNVQSVIRHKKIEFHRAISNFNIQWDNNNENSQQHLITKRYSHSACSYENSMYVFGGCTGTSTTFNDLWKLDLSTRLWRRLLTMGSYPSPKACASLVYYNNALILFGGWTHPSPYPLQAWRTFNELHIYDICTNRWSCITSTASPPPMAGHGATIHGDNMIIFGGLHGHSGGSNDIWCLNLSTYTWAKKETIGDKPHPRYGHSQIALDDYHLFILGGWGGPNIILSDIWLLSMNGRHWSWILVSVENQQWAASHLWCHPACKVEDYVVVLSRNPVSTLSSLAYSHWTSNSQIGHQRRVNTNESRDRYLFRTQDGDAGPSVDRDVNVNGRRGNLVARCFVADPINIRNDSIRQSTNAINYLNMSAFRADKPPVNRYREKQLDALKRMEIRLKNIKRPEQIKKTNRPAVPKMAMFVLDISKILSIDRKVSWLPIKSVAYGSPESTILYTLVRGNGELIMFGGIQKDAGSVTNQSGQTVDKYNTVSNALHFITAARCSI